jgi:hypothetical protein
MAKFETGKPKTGGRRKGTKNKTTDEIRKMYQMVLSKKVDQLEDHLDTMSPFQQWMVLDKLSNKVLPNLNDNKETVEHSGEIKINVSFTDDFLSSESPAIDDL